MLLVIFGAGASYDCRVDSSHHDWVPPLTKDVLDLRRRGYTEIANAFPGAGTIIDELSDGITGGSTGPLEHELAKLVAEADKWPDRKRPLLAIEFYLSKLFAQCSEEMIREKAGITNYTRLLTSLERWRNQNGETIAYVTFNYDTILDHELIQYGALNQFSKHLGRDRAYFKVHGSCDWARQVNVPGSTLPANLKGLLSSAPDLRYTGEWIVRDDPMDVGRSGNVWAPAIAVPIAEKDEYQLPPGHLEALMAALPHTTHVLVIGWRAQEKGFLELLRTVPVGRPLTVVTGSDVGARDVAERLNTLSGIDGPCTTFSKGFRQFVGGDGSDRGLGLREFVGRLGGN